ncbi:MAG: hypothetical protein RLZZ127_161 [Planctomycetota bacterium]
MVSGLDRPRAAPACAPMSLAPPADGYLRIAVRFFPGRVPSPGELAQAAGVALDQLGPIWIEGREARVDVLAPSARAARAALDRVGETDLVELRWRWIKLLIGRNHGFTLNRLKKLMAEADAGPLGKFNLNNTHTMVGVLDHRAEAIMGRLATARINGAALRAELLPFGEGPGDPAFG